MATDELIIRETTQPELSGYRVGVGNIWARDLPDEKGVVASRMSANLSITEVASGTLRHEKVFAGSVLALGNDRYLVVAVEEGNSAPGSITLRRLAPK